MSATRTRAPDTKLTLKQLTEFALYQMKKARDGERQSEEADKHLSLLDQLAPMSGYTVEDVYARIMKLQGIGFNTASGTSA